MAGPLLLLLVAAGLVVVAGARGGERQAFPHERHAGMFPLCIGCHEGVPAGDRSAFYPPPSQCATCHDGVERDTVVWTPPPEAPSPVRFSHPEHRAERAAEGREPLDCAACHTEADAPRMAVERVVTSRCFACHEHEADSHFVDADCATCHGPAAETPMGGEWLALLPYPQDHVRGDFLGEIHGQLAASEPARCITCHTQERCTSCHVDADDVPEIAAIPAASPGLELPRFAAHYTIPPSHTAPDFVRQHGEVASRQSCATCHTQDDCATCHLSPGPEAVQDMPSAELVMAPGVLLQGRAPESHASAWWVEGHGAEAAAEPSYCSTCHTRDSCAGCHEAPLTGFEDGTRVAGTAFHPPNFAARHSAEAYGRRLECASCHDTGSFCRDCHEQAGFETRGALGPGFHDAEPLWLLRHGQAARQALESCATCHEQRNCLQCHSTTGAFQVNPHGPGFDPERARSRNPGICFACHVSDPGGE
ncbi:MAG TPA: hypothetical protein VK966_04085 [Longimicrobiales bacterium]|nr:hypothetical protein [Longimicrobiales bacterium]